jgi:thiamine-monophosphate kinase
VTTIGGAGEFELLKLIRPYLAVQSGRDDAAVLDEESGFTVASTDTFVEGVHFDLGWMSGEDAGWRSLALALGDLAAKGATPSWALTSVALPRSWPVDALVDLYRGMHALAETVHMSIVGGDMSSIDGPAVLAITVVGHTESRPLARSEAQPGWAVGVTGPLGAAAVALREHRVLRLQPSLSEGRRLNRAGLCCGDISDGLVREMEKFAEFAGCGCILRAAEVPVAEGATSLEALTSGEEAELVCTGPESVMLEAGMRAIGTLTRDPKVNVVGPDEKPVQMRLVGYDHFA